MNRRKLIIVMLAVVLALTPMSVAWADTSSGEMTATDQKYVDTDNGKRIDSFKLDGKYTYQSVGNDSGKSTLTLNPSSIQSIVKEKLLPQWSGIAAGIFRDQASQLVDLYGYENAGGCMSQSGFDAYYDRARSGKDKYKNEPWSCSSLTDRLKQTSPGFWGKRNKDQLAVSGVKQFSSLSEARRMMGQALNDIENKNPVTVDDFLNVNENGESRLSSLDDDGATTGFVNIVTSANCKGSSDEYDYVSFGIAFYDFEPVPVAAKGLAYHSVEATYDKNDSGKNTSVVTNGQQQAIMHSALLGDAVTETTSTTLSGLASCKMSQNIGANIGWSETESSSSTSFWDDDTFGIGADTETSSSTTSMGLNWGAAWEMAGALGAEAGHSTSKEISKAVETTIALPPHTATNVEHTTTTTTYTQNYQQPVILSYKVAIFATSGDFTTAGGGGINPDSYDKQSLVIKFDTQDDSSLSYGCAATDDLYSRVVTNKSVHNYDSAGGRTFETHSDAKGFSKSYGISWDSVKSYAGNVGNVATTNYFYETPGKLSVEQEKTSSNVDPIYALYDLASVRTPKTSYVLYNNNTLDSDSLTLKAYNKHGVDFYGFDPEWGEWNRCDEEGTVIDDGSLLDEDPVDIKNGELVPKQNTNGGTIYLTWKFIEGAKAKTNEHPEGQDLVNSNIETPVVKIDVVNIGLDAPVVTAEGSYTGFYKKPINLHDLMTYEVTDSDDKILETQVCWESREPISRGIKVNSSTGDVTFSKPGSYKVRPYVVNNDRKKVYSDWLTVTATEHDLMHYDKKDPTCSDDGWTEHYRCSDCGKCFSDADGKVELSKDEYIIEAIGHDWDEWTTTKEVSGNEPGEQERVCKNDKNHVEKRGLYSVRFNVNGHGTAPEGQTVASGTSVTVPQDPAALGYTFDGWYEDKACSKTYDFGATVEDNLVLYAKWTAVKYTTAAMAIGDVSEDEEGELKIAPDAHGSITIEDGTEVTEDDYTYWYREVEYGTTVTLTVTPEEGYGLKEIMAIPVRPDSSMGEPFTPVRIGDNKYSFTVPAADVAVMASFAQVTVSYDGNAPEGRTAWNVPAKEKIACGSTPTKLDNKPSVRGYEFGGWFTDKDCTKPYLSSSALTEDTTLYAKWIKSDEPTYKVTYTLSWEPDPDDASDTGSYEDSYQAKAGSTAYDPTEALYYLAGKDLRAAYELYSKNDACWFKDPGLIQAFDFTAPINEATHLYAKVVTREYTVTYFNGKEELGSQSVAYNTAIGTIAQNITQPTKEGHDKFTGEWTTEDGAPWKIDSNPVTSDLKLFASWPDNKFSVKFDTNGGSGMKKAESVEEGAAYTLPDADTFTAPKGMCGLKSWEVKIGSGEAESKGPGDSIKVTANTTVKAIWVDPTPLNDAIKAAQGSEKGVKTSEDGKDVDPADMYTTAAERKALDDAITAAQKVANNSKSAQKQVDDAVADVNKARETYVAARKPGAKDTVGDDITVVDKRVSAAEAEKAILTAENDKDPAGSEYAPLMLKSAKQTKKSVNLTWNKVSEAKKYVIYGNACGNENKYKKLKMLGASKKTYKVKKIAGKKLKKKTSYKFIIVALDGNEKVVSISRVVHVATKGSNSKANPKGVTVKAKVDKDGKKIKKWKTASEITLKAGSTSEGLVASTTLKAKNKKAKNAKIEKHLPIRFESSNPNVVTVNTKGKLTAKTKGTATIYAVAQNGLAGTVKVTVK